MDRISLSNLRTFIIKDMTTSLDQLKQTGTVVVSDSGDFECKLSFFLSVPCI